MSTDLQLPSTAETVEIKKSIEIAAPIEICFEVMLEENGPKVVTHDNTPMPMKLEPWPGGRWFRDLGNNAGHLWGIVQVIKPPILLEIVGPMMMSYPAINHVQWRLTAEGNSTRLAFTHRGLGLIAAPLREGMPKGWAHWIERIGKAAEARVRA
jgi:uncharacterized protein YndB with AHSA1/START domain